MSNPKRFLKFLARDQRGMTTVEYVIALCLVGAVAVGLWGKFGNTIRGSLGSADQVIYDGTGDALQNSTKTDNFQNRSGG